MGGGVGHPDAASRAARRAVYRQRGAVRHSHSGPGGGPPDRFIGRRPPVPASAHHQGRLNQIEDVAQVGLGGGDRGSGGYLARPQHGQKHDNPGRAVGHENHHDPPARADDVSELFGNLARQAPQLGPGQGVAATYQGELAGPLIDVRLEAVDQPAAGPPAGAPVALRRVFEHCSPPLPIGLLSAVWQARQIHKTDIAFCIR